MKFLADWYRVKKYEFLKGTKKLVFNLDDLLPGYYIQWKSQDPNSRIQKIL